MTAAEVAAVLKEAALMLENCETMLSWTKEKLLAAQEENRKLKRIIMELTEKGAANASNP